MVSSLFSLYLVSDFFSVNLFSVVIIILFVYLQLLFCLSIYNCYSVCLFTIVILFVYLQLFCLSIYSYYSVCLFTVVILFVYLQLLFCLSIYSYYSVCQFTVVILFVYLQLLLTEWRGVGSSFFHCHPSGLLILKTFPLACLAEPRPLVNSIFQLKRPEFSCARGLCIDKDYEGNRRYWKHPLIKVENIQQRLS